MLPSGVWGSSQGLKDQLWTGSGLEGFREEKIPGKSSILEKEKEKQNQGANSHAGGSGLDSKPDFLR